MFELKTKFQQTTSLNEKIQILTLKPKSWTIEQTVKFFNATTYQVRTVMTVKKNKGVLSKPNRSVRKGIDQDSINNVILFYLDDEFSREMPGAKEYVSIGYKQHKQKRLLLSNLSKLYELHLRRNFKTLKLDFRNFVLFVQSGARQLVLLKPILYLCVPSIRIQSLHAIH